MNGPVVIIIYLKIISYKQSVVIRLALSDNFTYKTKFCAYILIKHYLPLYTRIFDARYKHTKNKAAIMIVII